MFASVALAGIRKPRLGNTALIQYAAQQGWILPGGELAAGQLGYAEGRNVNFSIPAAREWYVQQQAHYVSTGVDFFWNDEGAALCASSFPQCVHSTL